MCCVGMRRHAVVTWYLENLFIIWWSRVVVFSSIRTFRKMAKDKKIMATLDKLNLAQNSVVRYIAGLYKTSHISLVLRVLRLFNLRQGVWRFVSEYQKYQTLCSHKCTCVILKSSLKRTYCLIFLILWYKTSHSQFSDT